MAARLDGKEIAAALGLLQAAEARPSTCLTARDGALLRLVPVEERLTAEQLQLHLEAAATERGYFSDILHNALRDDRWYRTSSRRRCLAAFVRSIAYLQAGNARQGLSDAAVAISYAPKRQNVKPAAHAELLAMSCGWAPAVWAKAEAFHQLHQHVEAALHVLLAVSLEPTCSYLRQRSAQLLANLPADVQGELNCLHSLHMLTTSMTAVSNDEDNQVAADTSLMLLSSTADVPTVQQGQQPTGKPHVHGMEISTGASTADVQQAASQAVEALAAWMEKKRMMSTPELFRPKEKYHYYKQWMRGRILTALGLPSETDNIPAFTLTNNHKHHDDGGTRDAAQKQLTSWAGCSAAHDLPEAIVNKMVDGLMADDLDLLLKHPVAVKAQVVELLSVWLRDGEQGVQQHQIQPPSWEEVQLLTGPACLGLPLGSNGGPDHTSAASPLCDLSLLPSPIASAAALPQTEIPHLLTGPVSSLGGPTRPGRALLEISSQTTNTGAVLLGERAGGSTNGAAVMEQLYAATEYVRSKWGGTVTPTRSHILHSLMAKSA